MEKEKDMIEKIMEETEKFRMELKNNPELKKSIEDFSKLSDEQQLVILQILFDRIKNEPISEEEWKQIKKDDMEMDAHEGEMYAEK